MPPVVTRRKNIQFALAKVFEGKSFNNPYYAEPKYDGLRMVLIPDEGGALTRTGLPVPNAAHIISQMQRSGEFKDAVVDCEGLADDWNLSQSIIKSQEPHPQADKLVARCFDILSINEWRNKTCLRPLYERNENLRVRIARALCPNLEYTPHWVVNTADEVPAFMDKFVKLGYEGAMLKDSESLYPFKKSSCWLKAKPFHEGDFTIIGATEGRGAKAGMLGALMLVGVHTDDGSVQPIELKAWDEPHTAANFRERGLVVSEVGTGFDDAMRLILWHEHEHGRLVGRIVEVKYQDITEDYALRFPVFYRVRDDK